MKATKSNILRLAEEIKNIPENINQNIYFKITSIVNRLDEKQKQFAKEQAEVLFDIRNENSNANSFQIDGLTDKKLDSFVHKNKKKIVKLIENSILDELQLNGNDYLDENNEYSYKIEMYDCGYEFDNFIEKNIR